MCATTAAGFGRRASSAASADSNLAPRPDLRPRPRTTATRQFSGRTSGSAAVGEDDHLVARAPASARSIGTVAASAGWPGIDLLGDEDEPHQ